MFSSRSPLQLYIRNASGDLKVSMPRPQPRDSKSVGLGWSSRHGYNLKSILEVILEQIQRNNKQPVQPVVLSGEAQFWGGVFLSTLTSASFEKYPGDSTVTQNWSRVLGALLALPLRIWRPSWQIPYLCPAWALCLGIKLTKSCLQGALTQSFLPVWPQCPKGVLPRW